MTCLPGLLDTVVFAVRGHIATWQHPTPGKDRITHALKCLRNQGRADRPRRLAAPERTQAALQGRRDRGPRKPIAREVDDVLEIVAMTYTCKRMRDDSLAIFRAESDRTADAGVEIHVLGRGGRVNPLSKLASNQTGRMVARNAGL